MLEVVSEAPDFTLHDQNNSKVLSPTTRERWLLIWRCPATNTVGEAGQRLGLHKAIGDRYARTRASDSVQRSFPKRLRYLIGPDGRIVQAYEVIDPGGHAAAVLVDLEAAQR